MIIQFVYDINEANSSAVKLICLILSSSLTPNGLIIPETEIK